MTKKDALSSYRVCSLSEVPAMEDGGHSALLSIVDPDIAEVFRPAAISQERHLVVRFHDLIEPDPVMITPDEADIRAILQFGDRIRDERRPGVLIHCHMGISRSTAALAILLAQSAPERLEAVFPQVVALRPQAWPNSLMIRMADELLGFNGRMLRTLGDLYQHQIVHRPDTVDIIRQYGRAAEVKWALFGGISPADWKGDRRSDFEARLFNAEAIQLDRSRDTSCRPEHG